MFYMYMCMLVCIMYAYYVKVYSRAFEFHYRSTALCCISRNPQLLRACIYMHAVPPNCRAFSAFRSKEGLLAPQTDQASFQLTCAQLKYVRAKPCALVPATWHRGCEKQTSRGSLWLISSSSPSPLDIISIIIQIKRS
jgi:hypothetical protein